MTPTNADENGCRGCSSDPSNTSEKLPPRDSLNKNTHGLTNEDDTATPQNAAGNVGRPRKLKRGRKKAVSSGMCNSFDLNNEPLATSSTSAYMPDAPQQMPGKVGRPLKHKKGPKPKNELLTSNNSNKLCHAEETKAPAVSTDKLVSQEKCYPVVAVTQKDDTGVGVNVELQIPLNQSETAAMMKSKKRTYAEVLKSPPVSPRKVVLKRKSTQSMSEKSEECPPIIPITREGDNEMTDNAEMKISLRQPKTAAINKSKKREYAELKKTSSKRPRQVIPERRTTRSMSAKNDICPPAVVVTQEDNIGVEVNAGPLISLNQSETAAMMKSKKRTYAEVLKSPPVSPRKVVLKRKSTQSMSEKSEECPPIIPVTREGDNKIIDNAEMKISLRQPKTAAINKSKKRGYAELKKTPSKRQRQVIPERRTTRSMSAKNEVCPPPAVVVTQEDNIGFEVNDGPQIPSPQPQITAMIKVENKTDAEILEAAPTSPRNVMAEQKTTRSISVKSDKCPLFVRQNGNDGVAVNAELQVILHQPKIVTSTMKIPQQNEHVTNHSGLGAQQSEQISDLFTGYYSGTADLPRLPTEAILSDAVEPECVASGSFSQGNIPGSKYGTQCVIMSCLSICYKQVVNSNFTTPLVDDLLYSGDAIYSAYVQREYNGHGRLLDPEEVPVVSAFNYSISPPLRWIESGLNPTHSNEINARVHDLVKRLHYVFATNTTANGFVFVGLGEAYAFWCDKSANLVEYDDKKDQGLLFDNDCYFMFNSHAVNSRNCTKTTNNDPGRARLFKVQNLQSLARLLLNKATTKIKDGGTISEDNIQYTIHAVTLMSKINLSPQLEAATMMKSKNNTYLEELKISPVSPRKVDFRRNSTQNMSEKSEKYPPITPVTQKVDNVITDYHELQISSRQTKTDAIIKPQEIGYAELKKASSKRPRQVFPERKNTRSMSAKSDKCPPAVNLTQESDIRIEVNAGPQIPSPQPDTSAILSSENKIYAEMLKTPPMSPRKVMAERRTTRSISAKSKKCLSFVTVTQDDNDGVAVHAELEVPLHQPKLVTYTTKGLQQNVNVTNLGAFGDIQQSERVNDLFTGYYSGTADLPRLPIEGILSDAIEPECVASGSFSQGSIPGSNYGTQCVIMSCLSICYKQVVNSNFTTPLIDDLLYSGDAIYSAYVQQVYNGYGRLLDPEEVPVVSALNHSILRPLRWIESGLNPTNSNEINIRLHDLVKRLHYVFATNTNAHGFVFVGLGEAYGFWCKNKPVNFSEYDEEEDRDLLFDNECYFVFNSHAVNSRNSTKATDEDPGRARLFKVRNLQSLARLLLNKANSIVEDGGTITEENIQYTIHAVTLINETAQINETVEINSSSDTSTTVDTNKVGRPSKQKNVGRPKIKENAHLEAVMKYAANHSQVNRNAVKKYSESHPQVNREAVKKYSESHPQVNREAVKKYSESHPQVHREAVNKYSESHPQVHREAVKKYSESNPQINREAVKKYRRDHEDRIQQSNDTYYRSSNIEPHLRRTGLIGERAEHSLNDVLLFSFETTCLKNQSAVVCSFCHAHLFKEEKGAKMFCCGQGRYNILTLPEINTEEFYRNPVFLKRIRAYNNLFAFSALGVSHGFQQPDTGIAFLKIQGRTYHRVFDLSYTDSNNPIAMYIDDGEERLRLQQNQRLNQDILNEITSFLERVNPFIDQFRRLSLEPSDEAYLIFQRTNRETHGNVIGDMPRGSEVAAIIATEREQYSPKSIAIWKIGEGRPHTVDIFHPLYEAFQYPLLYPHGGAGWTITTLDNYSEKLTQVKYYKYFLLAIDRFVYLGRLSEEWLVDMYCRVEEERLQYVTLMQKRQSDLRIASADEVARNVPRDVAGDETIQGDDGSPLPGKIYLPNTFTGGPRFMKTKYMDAIAIVNRLGKPSYFLTMTCNPKWPEIAENTPPHLNPPAAICARVFKIKLHKLLQDLRNGNWFGRSVYILHVIEFQKRGLPHAHIVFRVEGGGPVQTPDIDRFIRADIPSEQDCNGRLRQLVLKHMIHGPCGPTHRTDLICWDAEKNKCLKHFPKRATDFTYVDDKGFIHLKRNPQNKAFITYRNVNVEVNDLYVVPYNAALLLKYDCHINLEIASTRKIVKYLFKYIHKGPDEARVAVVPEDFTTNNEVENYATRRYIGACEAAWRTFEFDTHGREPTVYQIAVHLDGQNTVLFRHGEESQALSAAKSDLIIYFNRPEGAEFDRLTYQDFNEQYMVHSKETDIKNVTIHKIKVLDKTYYVTKRQRGQAVARLFWVAPNRGEQFYLRLLLASFPCRSYSDLKSLGGENCNTFQSAARALGIANDEEEYATCLREASTFYTGKKLRSFFVLLVTNGAPGSILWDEFKNILSEDFLERFPNNENQAHSKALQEIDRLLRKHGSRLEDHGLPVVQDESTEYSRELSEYDHGRLLSVYEHWLPLLSNEQRRLFDYVSDLLNDTADNASNAIFLDGPSGTGKTLLLNTIVSYVRGVLHKIAICTASSGIAALNYEGGCTAHSMFKLPIELIDDSGYWNLTNGTQRAELIHKSALIIYDEAPMTHKYLIHILDRSLKDLMSSNKPFGGKVIIFSGDFRQIPPVVPNARCANDILNVSLKTSPLFHDMAKFSLTNAQRTRDDESYSEFLLNLGSGLLPTESISSGNNSLSLINIANISVVTELKDLIDFVFPDDILNNPDTCANRAILSTHLQNVHEINSNIVNKLEGEIIHCLSIDNVDAEQADQFYLGTDVLNSIRAKGVPDHDLTLKIGSVAMIIRNLSFTDRLVNGTKVVIVNITPRLIKVRKPNETETYLIPRITFKFPMERNSIVEICRRQFPLQLSYAMTIHKSQGQTIEKVGVDLRSDVFSHGQLYVALGRVRSRDNIRVLIHNQRMINNIPYVRNVIIQELIN